jgi:hypothetical protein
MDAEPGGAPTGKRIIQARTVDQDKALDLFRRVEREAERNAATHRDPDESDARKTKRGQQWRQEGRMFGKAPAVGHRITFTEAWKIGCENAAACCKIRDGRAEAYAGRIEAGAMQ